MNAPPGFFAAEAAGLRWLAEAAGTGGVPVVRVLEVQPDRIVLPRLVTAAADADAARLLGRRLAGTHAAGAQWFGQGPPGHDGDGFIGDLPLPLAGADDPAARTWPRFYATYRVAPYLRAARDRGALTAGATARIEHVVARLLDGEEDLTGPAEPPARLHGDLWSGNVVWTPDGAVLIDPAAHGGHRETDLAMLALFGLRGLPDVLSGYQEAAPLADGWESRVPLHQLHPLLVHAVLFGGGYGAQAEQAARRYA